MVKPSMSVLVLELTIQRRKTQALKIASFQQCLRMDITVNKPGITNKMEKVRWLVNGNKSCLILTCNLDKNYPVWCLLGIISSCCIFKHRCIEALFTVIHLPHSNFDKYIQVIDSIKLRRSTLLHAFDHSDLGQSCWLICPWVEKKGTKHLGETIRPRNYSIPHFPI